MNKEEILSLPKEDVSYQADWLEGYEYAYDEVIGLLESYKYKNQDDLIKILREMKSI